MSTPCPYRVTKGDDGLSIKVEWDVHYLTDEQIGAVRKYVAETEAENARLRELVKDLLNAWDDMQHEVVTGPTFDDCERRAYELGIEVDA